MRARPSTLFTRTALFLPAQANLLVSKGADVNCASTSARFVNGTTFAIGSTPAYAGYIWARESTSIGDA